MKRLGIAELVLLLLVVCPATFGADDQDSDTTANVPGFVGTWVEYWPGIAEHATHVVTFTNHQFFIRGSSPLTEAYDITDVRLDGETLKFREGTARFTVEYELRVKDNDTLAVRAKGMQGWLDDVVWKRRVDKNGSSE